MHIKIVPINYDSKIETLEKKEIKHKFLYESVKAEISYYEDKENTIYNFFGLYFLVCRAATKEQVDKVGWGIYKMVEDMHPYYGHYFETLLDDETVSQALRNSSTLKISDQNAYDNTDIKVVFSESGFVFCNKLSYDAKEKFERVELLFILALAYNAKVVRLMQEVATAHKSKSYTKMIELRDAIYSFDLNCFFYNPVKQNKHQVYTLWEIVSSVYDVKIKHDEIKSQITDLTGVIEVKQKEERDNKAQKIERTLTLVGIAIGIASLVSVFKDLKELVGF